MMGRNERGGVKVCLFFENSGGVNKSLGKPGPVLKWVRVGKFWESKGTRAAGRITAGTWMPGCPLLSSSNELEFPELHRPNLFFNLLPTNSFLLENRMDV